MVLSVIDDLNYRYGIMHQDIAARNLLVDVEDNLRIFVFNFSGKISEHYNPDRDDTEGVIFTLYEIMTLDEHYRDVPMPIKTPKLCCDRSGQSTRMWN